MLKRLWSKIPRRQGKLSQNVLELTFRYQKEHPDLSGGQRRPGRISLEKRPAYHIELTKLLIKDARLAELLLSTGKTFAEKWPVIVEYALARNGNNRKAAIRFVDKTINRIKKADTSQENIKKWGQKRGIPEEQLNKFSVQTHHMFGKWLVELISTLSYCGEKIKGNL